jgi:hypothetical protein
MNLSRLTWRPTPASTWIQAVSYSSLALEDRGQLPGVSGFLHLRIKGKVHSYAVPAWVFGLVCAAIRTGRSVGRIVRRYVMNRPAAIAEVA